MEGWGNTGKLSRRDDLLAETRSNDLGLPDWHSGVDSMVMMASESVNVLPRHTPPKGVHQSTGSQHPPPTPQAMVDSEVIQQSSTAPPKPPTSNVEKGDPRQRADENPRQCASHRDTNHLQSQKYFISRSPQKNLREKMQDSSGKVDS
ncbi:hypothetical protein SBOR_0955 [Sclerotinia borealis F-4128]|uniref:Uncharacterized protein n=1 Tax=Sclerotinia borealis (strain F-4128) TaxID=1432307 RepID=W9CPG5_SCLBF|nr:hypothetical protein SBOR_0955 [Sclerotinia borealis F-4128]